MCLHKSVSVEQKISTEYKFCKLQKSTEDSSAQDTLVNEAVFRPRPLLDQLAESLKCAHVVSYIRAIPKVYEPYFVARNHLTATMVKVAITEPARMTLAEPVVWNNLIDGRLEEGV